ncbi:exportin 1 [Klebsormidium nitens]|uniref:Exportin 1 n=1 Tax=Klebsormidium nitens TaxID=105231 RepID=A0A1Y1IL98_KLENI|nr:exportin 1 [Klebsormidium nitens]|eukprot:GAQ89407.1 exportin 1 [Klebsormidium nitens]
MVDKLLDFTQPFDVPLLDATVQAFYGTGSKEERSAAERVLRQLQEHPDTWTRVVDILQKSQVIDSKFFALQVLEGVIKFRWNALPVEQRDGIKNYVSELIVQLSREEPTYRRERLYINKLNIILVQVLKHEWPSKWPQFIPDLVAAAKSSETLCENCMVILKLLSEEVFDFSRGELTQLKIKELKNSLNSEFQRIHELCMYVLSASTRPELIRATLATLHAFLSWIPLGYIFESNLLEILLKLFPAPPFRNLTLQCLSEVAALSVGDYYNEHFVKLYTIFMAQLQGILPPGTDIPAAYAAGTDDEQAFIQNLALFLTGYFKSHVAVLEVNPETKPGLLLGLDYLLSISYVEDVEVFKVCLDYWNILVSDLFQTEANAEPAAAPLGLHIPAANGAGGQTSERKKLYSVPMSKLRLLFISRMAKPEEVLIVEDENGNIVRETMKDNDVLVQYKIMRETLIYLSHLDHEDTEQQMLKKLALQLNGKEWSWNNLNTLCWAIGSISGSMQEDQENRFLVTVIRDLLSLVEITRGKAHKAVIASNIMYVVGQYPRFLRAHWKFLKTVVNKLFEFMHETHPGVQDMACETFLKIVQKCRRKFVIQQVGEAEPFICELLRGLATTILDLQPHQIHMFYESVGYMIQAETEKQKQIEYLQKLMELPNARWNEIMAQAQQSVDTLKNPETARAILNILQPNVSVASALGQPFISQLSGIYLNMLNIYRMYSEIISSSIAEGGPYASKTSVVKLLRSVKRETLRLIETFVEKAEDTEIIAKQFVPAMLDPILGDYARNVPDARESEVLSLFAAIINKLKEAMLDEVPRIFEAVFECTLDMITKNFEDYPDHRLKFFSLLRAINSHCFRALFSLSNQQLKLVMDSIVWAFRHTERNVAETGLNLLLEMLGNFQGSEFVNAFHQTYFLTILQEIFAVLTDTFHKPGFKLHTAILQHLFCLVDSGTLTAPLWDVSTLGPAAYPNNPAFVRDYTIKLLSTSFPNLASAEVAAFVSGLFEFKNDTTAFKNHLRDFLVQSKGFSSQDNKDLYAEEAAAQREAERQRMLSIPGLIAPNEIQDDGMKD